MIGSNIRTLRMKKGMTQKALADQLFVSPQAISRWENNEVEPSLGTITELAKIFDVSTDTILGIENTEKTSDPVVRVEKEYVYKEAPKVSIALCEECNKPLYEPGEIVRIDNGKKIICKACEEKRRIQKEKDEKAALDMALYKGERRRKLSFIWGGIAGGVFLLLSIIGGCFTNIVLAIPAIVISIALFCYVSCFILRNNFLGDLTLEIISFGFVRMPGLIFELDIDGCMWFIAMKVLLWVLGIALALLATLLAFVIGMTISVFVYPYALIKNIHYPERTN